ncbi:haloacid dehalogenase type II [Paraburkholderia flava]|uniref:haloacid dehalogenase type II n=1 Tax=Paraburkholderia flava TaxID=2547393 RepID=UPI001981B532|nr:haloacid dehalogenase type II [Paraburkholderia flava]
MNRRHFMAATIAGAAVGAIPALAATNRIKAVAFDGLALFDPRPVFASAETLFPGNGRSLVATWRGRLFDYTWLRTLTGTYADFLQVADDALMFAVDAEKIAITDAQRHQLVAAFMNLKAWPDVPPVLKALKQRGLGLAPLNDFTVPMLEAAIANSGLTGVFDHLLSTDLVKAYKPDPRAYQMAVDAFGLQRDEIAFVAFAGWDAVGAKSFGYPTIWVNRMASPAERLGVLPDAVAQNFEAIPGFVGS